MFHSSDDIRVALKRLGLKLALRGTAEYALLICGGSALNLTGAFTRSTRDVDALGIVNSIGKRSNSSITSELPDELTEAAQEVALELHLDADWLNTAAEPLLAMGLPTGVLERAERFEFGPCLTILAISRQDQIALKFYASLDGKKGRRHLDDLIRLKPVTKEMEFASAWLLDRPTSLAFRQAARKIATGLGHSALKAFQPPQRAIHKRKRLRK